MNRGQRQHDERRVAKGRTRRFPFYRPKYGGKTPGKMCSCPMCGNRRAHEGPSPSERRRLQDEPHRDAIDYSVESARQEWGYDRECECRDDSCPFVRDSIIENAQIALVELRSGRPASECSDQHTWYEWYRAHVIARSCRMADGTCDGSCNSVALARVERVLGEYAVVIQNRAGLGGPLS